MITHKTSQAIDSTSAMIYVIISLSQTKKITFHNAWDWYLWPRKDSVKKQDEMTWENIDKKHDMTSQNEVRK